MLPVEAKSLSSLIQLAANPPQYPRNITHEPRQPVVLYIVRVPGSQDVFLTPLKPPTKASINVEAINTSLYYLHVSTPEDDILRDSLDVPRDSPAEQISPASSIQRKPLPPSPYSNEPHERPVLPPKSYPDYQPRIPDAPDDTQVTKYTFRHQNVRLGTSSHNRSQSIPKRPLGPRPQHGRLQSTDESTVRRKPVGSPQIEQHSREDTLGPRESFSDYHEDDGNTQPSNISYDRPSGTPLGHSRQQSDHSTSSHHHSTFITIIRRDPSSGLQWNVGSISIDSDPFSDNSRIELQITTPGYQKFARDDSFPKLENLNLSSLMGSTDKEKIIDSLKLDTSMDSTATNTEPQVFTRHLTLPRSKPRSSRQGPASDPSSHPKLFSKVTAPPPATRPPVHIPHINTPQKSPLNHFSFLSPWQGICTFSTAMDGRSLKCRHVLPSAAAADMDVTPAAPVIAEVRFNLPWPSMKLDALKKKDLGNETKSRPRLADSAKSGLRSSFQKIKNKSLNRDHDDEDELSAPYSQYDEYNQPRNSMSSSQRPSYPRGHSRTQSSDYVDSDSDSDEHDRPFDLSLGREKAGGGRRGKSAKLGKLILRDEGLKMMDLVVAAGMGVWWGIHNRDKMQS